MKKKKSQLFIFNGIEVVPIASIVMSIYKFLYWFHSSFNIFQFVKILIFVGIFRVKFIYNKIQIHCIFAFYGFICYWIEGSRTKSEVAEKLFLLK